MKKKLAGVVAFLTTFAFAADPLGDWYGTLTAGSAQLRLALHLTKASDGTYKASLDSLDQAAMGMAADSVTVAGNKIVAEWANLRGRLEVTANEAGTELEGTWSQAGNTLPLKLTRTKIEVKEGKPVPLTATERDFLISHLEQSRREFLKSIEGLTPEQWKHKPANGGWSIAECAEHIVVSEDFIPGFVKDRILKTPIRADITRKTQADDEKVIARTVDRSQKGQAPEPLQPTGKYPTPDSVKSAFNASRDRNIQFVRTTQEDLRGRLMGQMDAYQYLVLLSAHTQRHTAQLNEVKTDSGYSK